MKRKRILPGHRAELHYDRLEDRQLLAGDLIRTPIINLPKDKNLVVNYSFEQATNGVNDMYNVANVPGWNTIAGAGNQVKIFKTGSTSRGNVLQIDHTANQRDGIYQDIEVRTGRQYLISFEMRQFSDRHAGATNDIEVFWNGESLGVFRPGARFERFRVTTPVTTGNSGRLEFREAAGLGTANDDGVGALLDNVQVVQLTNDNLKNGDFANGTNQGANPRVFGWTKRGLAPFVILPERGPSGQRALKLDSDANSVDLIRQRLQTTADESYLISFNARLAPDQNLNEMESQVRVRFGDRFIGTVLPTKQWVRFHLLAKATGPVSDLVLREAGMKNGQPHTGDGKGPWIDDVRVTRITANWELGVTSPVTNHTFIQGSPATKILSSTLTVFNRVRPQLTNATIWLRNARDGASEILTVDTTGTSITANYDATRNILSLTGVDSIQNYKQVLETVAYANTKSTLTSGVRDLRVTIGDRGAISEGFNVKVNVVPNSAPQVTPIADQSISAGRPFVLQVNATDANGDSLTYSIQSNGTALGPGETGPTISSSGEIRWTPSQGGTLNVTVTVSDSRGGSTQETFVLNSLLNSPLGSFQPFSGQQQLSFVTPALRNRVYTQAPPMNIDTSKSYRATIYTDLGPLVLDLFASKAPVAVNSFINLARDGFYDGLNFHRVINDPGNRFVAQGGDPLGIGSGGPGYQFANEIDPSLQFDKAGVLATANAGPTSNSSQFFITYSPQPHLNGKHTIFGQLVSGSSVLDQFQSTQGTTNRVIMRRIVISEI